MNSNMNDPYNRNNNSAPNGGYNNNANGGYGQNGSGGPNKRLTKVADGKKICGVCMGFARYFDIDVTLVRLIYVIVSLVCGIGLLGLIVYFVCALIMPEENSYR